MVRMYIQERFIGCYTYPVELFLALKSLRVLLRNGREYPEQCLSLHGKMLDMEFAGEFDWNVALSIAHALNHTAINEIEETSYDEVIAVSKQTPVVGCQICHDHVGADSPAAA